jgi:hypothetical protein
MNGLFEAKLPDVSEKPSLPEGKEDLAIGANINKPKKETPRENKKIKIFSEMPAEFQAAKNAILEMFSENEIEGIDITRVKQFFENQGLMMNDFIVVDKNDAEKIKKIEKIISEKTGFSTVLQAGGIYGRALTNFGIAIVFRDREMEKLNGAILTEGNLVHELFHLAQNYDNSWFVDKKTKIMQERRLGFSLPYLKVGAFFEEGAAEMFRAEYFKQYADESDCQKIETASLLNGINGIKANPDDTFCFPYGENVFPLPIKYCRVHMGKEGKPEVLVVKSAVAGYAMELLCQQNPELKNIIKKARQSAEGLREFREAVGKIDPEIYQELFCLYYQTNDFMNGLALVICQVKGGIKNVIAGNDKLKLFWNELLKKASCVEYKKREIKLQQGVYPGGFHVAGEKDRKDWERGFPGCSHGRNVAPIYYVRGSRGREAFGITPEQAMERYRKGKYGHEFTLNDLGLPSNEELAMQAQIEQNKKPQKQEPAEDKGLKAKVKRFLFGDFKF